MHFRSKSLQFVALAIVAFAFAGYQGGAVAETTLEKIKRTGVMSSANSFEYAPFGYVENGKPVGLDVDLGEEIARRMGVKIAFEKLDFKGIVAALSSGRVDTLITAMTWTPERAERMLFSEPYFDGGIGAAYRPEAPVSKPEDIVGKRIGLQIGTVGDRWTREKFPASIPDIKTYDSTLLALKDLENGRIDVVVSALPAVRYAIRNMKTIKVTAPWDSRIVGVNTRMADKDLIDEINRHMVAMKKDGTMDKLIAKWFGA